MQAITEASKVHEQWYVDAKNMTLDRLPGFLKGLTTEYKHDYGTICHAMAAASIATMWAIDSSETGGITGFQASCVMWQVMRHWLSIQGPARILQYEEMLFPQYEHKFRTIDCATWATLKAKAAETLTESGIHPDVRAHMESIVAGVVPFGYRVEG